MPSEIAIGPRVDFAKIMIGLIITLIMLMLIKQAAPRYAWGYVIVVVLGVMLSQRVGLGAFVRQLQARL